MSSQSSYQYTREGLEDKKRKKVIHPIWRGVGLILIFIIPVFGYLGSLLVLKSNQTSHWLIIPRQLIVPGPDPLLLVKAILTIIIGSFAYFILMMATFIIYRIFNPPVLGPTDVPPVDWKK